MKRFVAIAFAMVLTAGAAFPQTSTPAQEETIKIRTQLVQLDVVVVDKAGHIVKGLTKNDFEIVEKGKKQNISFFEFVDAGTATTTPGRPDSGVLPSAPSSRAPGAPPEERDVKRIFAFVVDDLTIRFEDMTYVRQMLTNFVDNEMQPSDLVAITRTVGGKGLLQVFTSDKDLLHRAIVSLTPASSPYSVFEQGDSGAVTNLHAALDNPSNSGVDAIKPNDKTILPDLNGNATDIASPQDETFKSQRALMTLGSASFMIDGMKELPGRKAMVLISGGLPVFSSGAGGYTGNISFFLNQLEDKATRAGVAIHTLDIRGLSGQSGVADFRDTPGKSALSNARPGAGRTPDVALFGDRNPIDTMEAHQGLRELSSSTGGIAVLNRNDFNAGLKKIVDANDGYYLVAYTPSDGDFKNDYRKVEIKVKQSGLTVYSRKGYFAREEKPAAAPTTPKEQLLAAIKSPLARRDVDIDATVVYKAESANQGAVGIEIAIDPHKLTFEQAGDKWQANYDVAGFVLDELGKLRGGFAETINAPLDQASYNAILKDGIVHSEDTKLPPGVYQIRIAVRDNKTGALGTTARYLEVPDLSKGTLAASSLLLGAQKLGDPQPSKLSATRRVPKSMDLRYGVYIYNPKGKDGKPRVKTQLVISQNGQRIFKEAEKEVPVGSKSTELVQVGQLGLSKVKPGRYTMTLLITDTLADKKAQTLARSMDFTVVE